MTTEAQTKDNFEYKIPEIEGEELQGVAELWVNSEGYYINWVAMKCEMDFLVETVRMGRYFELPPMPPLDSLPLFENLEKF